MISEHPWDGLISNPYSTVDRRARSNSLALFFWFLLITGTSVLLGLVMIFTSPKPAYIAWLLFLIGVATIFYQPRYGVYLIVFLSLVGDKGLMYWYPFHLNFSSGESIFYVNSRVIFSPMEVYLVLTFMSWLLRGAFWRKLHFYRTDLTWAALIFLSFVLYGMAFGLVKGGNLNIALWEARPIFYLPLMLILASNLITERSHFFHLMWCIAAALFIEGVAGTIFYLIVQRDHLNVVVEMIMEHSAGVHINSFFILVLAVWLYKGTWKARLLLPMMAVPILVSYLMIQRRSAILALVVALVFLALVLYKENRRAFWIVTPAAALLLTALVIAGWNSQGMLGLPARAIKSQFFPQLSSMRDQASDIYRVIENYNIFFTIRSAPLTGIGFGRMFYMPISLPDISFFVWYRYITHNSIGWIWMKTGMGGFISMLFLIGLSIMTGVHVLFHVPDRMMRAVVLTLTLYILMHFIFAYVDMSWDNQSMVYIGTAMGLISCAESVLAHPSLPKPITRQASKTFTIDCSTEPLVR